ncbi:hypothetical protein LSH36_586g01016 [Paralvinella palmiformis]|uniref:Uncharacterized protein n=1 Tax=Paralvinella palmiformis TaxID=53620 RepID=A0AAD9MXM1_9ANNE|nr:hypothetical protein LSH36_586g01016 [Paralvinella palmiformis]
MILLNSTFIQSAVVLGGTFPMYYVNNALQLVIVSLNINWFTIIVGMAYRWYTVGQVEKDGRSDTELETNSEDNDIIVKQTEKPVKEYQANGARLMNNNKTSRNGTRPQTRKL